MIQKKRKGSHSSLKLQENNQLDDKEGEFGFTEKNSIPATYILSTWEENNIKEKTLKSLEPEEANEFYDLQFDNQGVYGWSCQANLENSLEKVKSDLGDRDYNRLRELFEYYAAVVSPLQMGKIESYQFHLFLKDHDLYHDGMNRTQANLILKKVGCSTSNTEAQNNAKSINFESFCKILTDFALKKYPWEKNKSIALRQFVKHSIFSKKFFEKEKKFEKVLDELYSPGVQDFLGDKKKMVYYYELFNNNSKEILIEDKSMQVIDLIQANKL